MRNIYKVMITLMFAGILGMVFAQDYSWQKPHAKVLPTGDLEWTPEDFEYSPGEVVRYIDFESGNDANDGATKATAWKHHPWDPAATAKAKSGANGVDTFVFKQGVTYRGNMIVPDGTKGSEDNPIRITRDPSWGEGEAKIYGSEVVKGWKQGASNPDVPDGEKVWTAEVDFIPQAVWMVGDTEKITRVDMAKTPNWTVSAPQDVMSEWFEWENPEWWKHMKVGDERATVEKKNWGVYGIDKKNLTESADYYEGAIIRSEWGIVMGMPMPSRVEHFDEEAKALSFATPFLGPGFLIKGQRYYLEDKPQYLDIPGEFWLDRKGKGGTLNLRLPGDIDPNTVTIEAAKRINLIDSDGMSHVEISGLTFRFSNYYKDLAAFMFMNEDVLGACVRMLGGGEDIRVVNNTFEHVNKAVLLQAKKPADYMDAILIADNLINYTDHGAIHVRTLSPRKADGPEDYSHLGHVDLLRNNLFEIGMRFPHMGHEHAVNIRYPESLHVAGNFVYRTYQAGMDIAGAKGHGQKYDSPFTRLLIHHNRIEDPILASNDWGALYVNQGGPGYVYNNVVRNPGGFANWRYRQGKKEGTPRFGHAYYLDGSYKKYEFNNIAWGMNNEQGSKYANESAFQTLISFENQIFNNTAYRFVQASRNQTGQLGRWLYLGNIYQDVSEYVFRHSNPKKKKDPNAADAGEQGDQFNYESYGYKNNLFHKITGSYGLFESSGKEYDDLETMREAMAEKQLLASEIGTEVETSFLKDPENMDMRPTMMAPEGSGAAKVFVPWPLYAVVGEWHFMENREDPARLIDQHWYMQSPYPEREYYINMPRYPLRAEWAAANSYKASPLENWANGVLEFDGQPAVLSQSVIKQGAEYKHKKEGTITVPGSAFKTVDMDTNSFIIEAIVRADTENAVLVEKMGDAAGYRLAYDPKALTLELKGPGGAQTLNGPAISIAEGRWQHILVEVDRKAGKVRFYLDGKLNVEDNFVLDAKANLSNSADFQVGRDFKGAFDFLRISRGSLSDARTSIEELYEWQFNGPFLFDFAGRKRDFNRSAPGAVDYEAP